MSNRKNVGLGTNLIAFFILSTKFFEKHLLKLVKVRGSFNRSEFYGANYNSNEELKSILVLTLRPFNKNKSAKTL